MILFEIVILFIYLTFNFKTAISQSISDHYCPFRFESYYGTKCVKLKNNEYYDEYFVDCIGNRWNGTWNNNYEEEDHWRPYYIDNIYDRSNILQFENICVTARGNRVKCNSYQTSICEVDSINRNFHVVNYEDCREGFFYYKSPKPICLTAYISKKGTRKQMEKYCEGLSGTLIKEGMIYIDSIYEVPTSIIRTDDGRLQYENMTKYSDELLELQNVCRYTNDLKDKYISMVNASYCITRDENFIYEAVICEHPAYSKIVTFKNMGLNLTSNGGKLYVEFETNKPSNTRISCFTDDDESLINISVTKLENIFEWQTNENGLYRCISDITDDGHIPKSPLVLFINNTDILIHTYIFNFNNTCRDLCDAIINRFFSKLTLSTKKNVFKGMKIKSSYYDSFYITAEDYFFDIETMKNENLYSVINGTFTLEIVSSLCGEVWNIITADGSCVDRYEGGSRLYSWNASECIYERFHCETTGNSTLKIAYPVFEGVRVKCGKNLPSCLKLNTNVMQIDEKMKSILTKPISENDVHNLIDDLSDAISSSTNVRGSILEDLDTILKQMDLKNVPGNEFHSASPNLLIGVIEIGNDKNVFRCRVKTEEDFKKKQIEFLRNETSLLDKEVDVIVELQTLKTVSDTNLAVVVMKDDKLFTSVNNEDMPILNSMIIGISVDNFTFSEDNPYTDIHFKPFAKNIQMDEEVKCSFWDFNIDDWSNEGCVLLNEEIVKGLHTCRCTHLTHFAEILLSRESKSQKHQMQLTIITYISCGLSLFGLLIITITAIVFKKWRHDFKIHLNLSAAIAILEITFLMNTFIDSASNNEALCLSIGILMHYVVLAAFTWVLMVALIFDQNMIKVFGSHLFFLKIYLCGWLAPLIPVVLLITIHHQSYTDQFKLSQNTLCCYPSGLGFWLGVFIPIASMVLINTIIYLKYLCKFYKVRSDTDVNYKFDDIFNNFCMFFLLGVTWIFGIFSQNLVMSYLFCLLAPLQGFVLFLFIIVCNAETKNQWKQKLNLERAKSENKVDECSISKYHSTDSDESPGGSVVKRHSVNRSHDSESEESLLDDKKKNLELHDR